jgi:hypothetical protein
VSASTRTPSWYKKNPMTVSSIRQISRCAATGSQQQTEDLSGHNHHYPYQAEMRGWAVPSLLNQASCRPCSHIDHQGCRWSLEPSPQRPSPPIELHRSGPPRSSGRISPPYHKGDYEAPHIHSLGDESLSPPSAGRSYTYRLPLVAAGRCREKWWVVARVSPEAPLGTSWLF